MTFLPRDLAIVAPLQNCHWSMTVFKIVIDRSMTVLCVKELGGCTFTDFVIDNSQWQTHSETLIPESVIDWSMTIFSYGHKWLTIVNDTRTYGHLSLTLINDTKTYGHLSLIVVNDNKKCHWLQSMTKKTVIECILSI